MAMSPRQRAAMGLYGERGARSLESREKTPWSSILSALGTVGGAVAAPLTGGASLLPSIAAGAAIGGTVGRGVGELAEGAPEGFLARAGETVKQYGAFDRQRKAQALDKRFRDRLTALGIMK